MGTAPGRTEEKCSGAPLRRGGVPQKIYWEGINLNKISKKIVSLVTTAAFLTTLVPAAAFAAPLSDTQDNASVSLVGDENQVVMLDSNGKATVTVDAKTETGWSSLNTPYLGVWAGTENEADSDVEITPVSPATGYEYWNAYWVTNLTTSCQVTLNFDADDAGKTFDIYSGIYENGDPDLASVNGQKIGTVQVIATDASASPASSLLIDGKDTTASIEQGTPKEFAFDVRTDEGKETDRPFVGNVYIWVENAKGDIVKNAVIAPTEANADDFTLTQDASGYWTVTKGSVKDDTTFTVMIPNKGEGYSLHAAVGVDFDSATELNPIGINVTAKAFTTDTITIDGDKDDATIQQGATKTNTSNGKTTKTTTWTYAINDNVTPNGLKNYTVTGKAVDKNGVPAENETLKITCQNAGLTLKDTEVTTDANGEFSFDFSLTDTGSFIITVAEANNDAFAQITVTQDAMAPVSISTVKDGGLALAGTDPNFIYNDYNTFGEAVQFNIKDAYDRDATEDTVLTLLAAAHADWENHSDFIDVTAPEGSKLTDDDIELAWDGNVYTLKYVGDDQVHDLIPGEYTVKVSLNNGKSATATFTLAEFQGAESLDISMYAGPRSNTTDANNNNAITAIDDQVALGQDVTGTVYLVDAQGLKILAPASNLSIGVNGAALAQNSVVRSNPFTFATVSNIPANQSVIGSIITVKAYDEVNKMYVEKELTVVSNYGDETLSFDPTQGPVGETNGVDVTVVDADGNLSKVNGTMTAYIASQSDEDAKITLRANETVKNGAGKLYLESDKAGTADVVVAVKASNGEIYAGTLTYTFGEEAANAGEYVIMTIGSDQYFINGKMFDGSADKLGAPYIDSAWRTMVPIRALAESFGATVDYADGVVTIVDGDTTVVMNIGEQTYTVNGEEANMDTAPVIGDGDRTYVPVRFVAEALGYSVTPLYGADGLTSSVHFSK